MSKICDLNDQLLNWASATAEAKDTAPTTAAALSATSTVTAAVYSQVFLRFLGAFSLHAWAELVLSS